MRTETLRDRYREKREYTELRRVTVVGGGIVGMACAWRLQLAGYFVDLYDASLSSEAIPKISLAAAAQFLPFPPHYLNRPVMQKELRFIRDGLRTNQKIYDQLSTRNEETGVMKIYDVELLTEGEEPWDPLLLRAMGAKEEKLDPTIVIENWNNGQPLIATIKYEIPTYSINSPKTLQFLLDDFRRLGGNLYERRVTPEELREFDHPVVQAGGINAPNLAGDEDSYFYKGVTMVYPSIPDLPPVSIGIGDFVIMPRSDGSVVVGAPFLHKPNSHVVEQEEIADLVRKLEAVSKLSIGRWKGLPPGALGDPVSYHVGHRVILGKGVTVGSNPEDPNIFNCYGFAGHGWSTAFGAAELVLKEVKSYMKTIKTL